jgi:cytochrome P450
VSFSHGSLQASESKEEAKTEIQEDQTNSVLNKFYQYGSGTLNFFSRTSAKTFSLIAGDYPYKSYVGGLPFFGKLLALFSRDGRGLDRILTQAFHVGKENNGIGWWRFTSFKDAALVLYPENIKEIAKDNLDKVQIEDGTDSFKLFFGPNTIFSAPTGTESHSSQRAKFLHFLMKDVMLSKDAPKMQAIISHHIHQIEQQEMTVENLERFANSLTLDMIGITKLGLHEITEEDKKKISDIIAEATIELANPYEQIVYPYLRPFLPWESRLDQLLKEGHAIIRKILSYNEDSILAHSNTNWLTSQTTDGWVNTAYEAPHTLYSQAIFDEFKQFIVAGHETTSKLLTISLMLLGDSNHKFALEKVREEVSALEKLKQEEVDAYHREFEQIDAHEEVTDEQMERMSALQQLIENARVHVHTWGREEIARLPYTQAVIDETLRLYPPIPDMVFKIKKDIHFAGGKCHANPESIIFVSPRFTARCKAVWGEDAEDFKPERFLRIHKIERAREVDLTEAEIAEKKLLPFKHFPFGFKPRPCVGKEFSKQEVGLILARVVNKFNFSQTSKKGEVMHHPFDFHQIFTLHLAEEEVRMKFAPLDAEHPEKEAHFVSKPKV